MEFQHCVQVLKNSYKKHEEKKKSRCIVFLNEPPKNQVVENLTSNNATCQATTMKGEKCKFKAVCGKFCKKHDVSTKNVLGSIPKINNVNI